MIRNVLWSGLIVVGLAARAMATETRLTQNFDSEAEGAVGSGWESGFFGKSGSPRWEVVKEKSAPSPGHVLKQSGKADYNWLVRSDVQIKDGRVACAFKIDSGVEDPEAGIVWRFKDGENYVYVRANTTENNLVLYRMTSGKKELLKAVEAKVSRGDWHHVEAEFKGEDIAVTLDGKKLLFYKDKTRVTLGKVGFFTTADTTASFDDLKAEPL